MGAGVSLQPLVPALARGVVHLWQVRLDEVRPWYATFLETLSPGERMRAVRYRVSEVRERFVLTRGSLRALLSKYCGRPAPSIDLAVGRYGKPYVASPDRAGLSFNLAHSGNLAMYAFAHGWEVGIDVERPQQVVWTRSMLRAVFSEDEQAYLATLDLPERQWAACRMWTMKEAKAKATGLGLGRSLRADEPPCRISTCRWYTFEVTSEYIATVALYCRDGFKDQTWALIHFHFPG